MKSLTTSTEQKMSSSIDIIKSSFDIFFKKENFIYFVKIYALLLPFQLFFLYQNYFVDTQSKLLNSTNAQQVIFKYPLFLAAVILVNLVYLIISFWVDVTAIFAISKVVGKKSESYKETFKQSWKILWPFSLLSILIGLIGFGGIILLIIPGIIFSIWYGFSKFIFVNQGTGIVESLKVSKKLVQGKFWQVLGRSAVFVIFTILFQAVFTLVPYNLGSILSPFFGALTVLPYYLLYKEISG